MAEPLYKFKLIIGSISLNEDLFSRNIDNPVYSDSLEELSEILTKRKQEIEKKDRKIWFYKVWEFGKADYMDMGDDPLDFYKNS